MLVTLWKFFWIELIMNSESDLVHASSHTLKPTIQDQLEGTLHR